MVNLLAPIIGTAMFCLIAGAITWFIYKRIQPKKTIYTALVYRQGPRTKGNKFVNIVPYRKDVLIRLEGKHGRIDYRLVGMKVPVQPVDTDCIEDWNPKLKVVHLMFDGECATPMKKKYNAERGKEIFKPLPVNRQNMIQSNILYRQERIGKPQDILQKLAPIFTMIFVFLTVIGMTWLIVGGYEKISENFKETAELQKEGQVEAAQVYRDAIQQLVSGGANINDLKTDDGKNLGNNPPTPAIPE